MNLLGVAIANGWIWADNATYTYVGRAYDGTIVEFGSIDDIHFIEQYLIDHPTPEYW